MEKIRLCDSEYRFLQVVWEAAPVPSGQLAELCRQQLGWKKSTVYTVIKKLVGKGAIERCEPNFSCRAIVTKEQVRQREAAELMDKLFDGSAELFLSAYVGGRKLSADEIKGLRQLVEKLE